VWEWITASSYFESHLMDYKPICAKKGENCIREGGGISELRTVLVEARACWKYESQVVEAYLGSSSPFCRCSKECMCMYAVTIGCARRLDERRTGFTNCDN
jgi:hypothetical protein